MPRQIYVNLPVRDLGRARGFFSRLGFGFNPQFSDVRAACMIVVDNSFFVMLLAEPFFTTFTSTAVAVARKSTEVLVCLSCNSKDEVDGQDLDGHIWELVHMRSQP
jgi:predicted lactoylglutathione lyase